MNYSTRRKAQASQPYLEALYMTIFCLGYYGLMRIGELTRSLHVVKAGNIHVGNNKNKIMIVLYSSKTHGKESRPQEIKITEVQYNSNRYRQSRTRFFCPFKALRKFIAFRGGFDSAAEQFFIFRDGFNVESKHVRKVLKLLLKRVNLDHKLYDTQSFRFG